MVDPLKDLAQVASDLRTDERGWIATNPHLAILVAYLAGFVTFGVLALVL